MEATKRKVEEKQKALLALQEKVADSKDPKTVDQFEKERRELDRFIQDSREDFGRQIDAFSKDLMGKALGIIQNLAKSKGVDIVIDKSQQFRSPVLYGQDGIDITSEVIAAMDK